jgi:hypothetical protein
MVFFWGNSQFAASSQETGGKYLLRICSSLRESGECLRFQPHCCFLCTVPIRFLLETVRAVTSMCMYIGIRFWGRFHHNIPSPLIGSRDTRALILRSTIATMNSSLHQAVNRKLSSCSAISRLFIEDSTRCWAVVKLDVRPRMTGKQAVSTGRIGEWASSCIESRNCITEDSRRFASLCVCSTCHRQTLEMERNGHQILT